MADRGERQARILGLVLRWELEGRGTTITSRDVVEASGVTQATAALALGRYHRQGLLHRDRELGVGPPVYLYSLTKSGRGKAYWFLRQGRVRTQEQLSLPGLEPEQAEPRVVRPPVHRRARVLRPKVQRGGESW